MENTEKQKIEPRKDKFGPVLLSLPLIVWRFLTRLYYRTKFYLIHQWRLREFVFINFWVFAVLVAIVGVLYGFLKKDPFYFAIPSLSTELYITENILRTISIFVGIVFSFIVLSFNIFYKYFGRFAFLKFFTGKHIKFIFTLFIADMVLLLYSCGYLKEGRERDAYGNGLFILSMLVSLVLVLSIIPTLILLLRSSQNRDNIQQLISQFNRDWSISYHINVLWKEGNENTHFQRDPVTLLIEIGTTAIKEFDRTTLIAIKQGCLTHLKKMHSDYEFKKEVHPNDFYHKLYELTRNLFPIAIKERNEIAALIIVNFHLDIEEFYLQNFKDFNVYQSSEHYYDGIGFNVAMKEFFLKAIQFNEDSVSADIIDSLRKWWSLVITSYLPGISYDYPKDERFPTDKISSFISYTYSEFENIFDQIFTYKKVFLYKKISTFFGVLNLEIVESKNTRNTIVYLLQRNGLSMMSSYEKFVDLSDSEVSWGVYPFDLATTQEISKIKSQIPLQYELRAFEYLFQQKKLNAFVINNIKAIAYHAMAHFSEDGGHKKALLSIIQKFDRLRSYVNEDASDRQKETYLLLERYLGYIESWIPEYKVHDEDVSSALSTALNHFNLKDIFTKELNAKGFTIRDVR